MIFLVHKEGQPKEVLVDLKHRIDINFDRSKPIGDVLFKLSEAFPTEFIAWCDYNLVEFCDVEKLRKTLVNDRMMVSSLQDNHVFSPEIGYVDQSSFIKVNRKVQFPTWKMSSSIGAIHASVLDFYKGDLRIDRNFDYFLNSISKKLMPLGIFCYHVPDLLNLNKSNIGGPKSHNQYDLFKFVKELYGLKWTIFLMVTIFLYEKKFKWKELLSSLHVKKHSVTNLIVQDRKWLSPRTVEKKEIDIVIPTLGRKEPLKNFLNDLNIQSLLPNKVILVEQIAEDHKESQLNDFKREAWNFKLEIIFLEEAGVCNARNIGLSKTTSSWVFLADDDIRVSSNALAEFFEGIEETQAKVLIAACLQPGGKKNQRWFYQTSIFGAGCCIIRGDIARSINFDTSYEFGYGEDSDYGMQLRNMGVDIFYSPLPEITHLKYSSGGFRTKFNLPWKNEPIQPKPSPQIMLFHCRHRTSQQILGYKLWLFINLFRTHKPLNLVKFIKNFKNQWNSSVKWAKIISDTNSGINL